MKIQTYNGRHYVLSNSGAILGDYTRLADAEAIVMANHSPTVAQPRRKATKCKAPSHDVYAFGYNVGQMQQGNSGAV